MVRAVDRVAAGLNGGAELVDVAAVVGRIEQGILAVAHLAFTHPKRAGNLYAAQRAFVFAALRVAHNEFAGRDKDHVEHNTVGQREAALDGNTPQRRGGRLALFGFLQVERKSWDLGARDFRRCPRSADFSRL